MSLYYSKNMFHTPFGSSNSIVKLDTKQYVPKKYYCNVCDHGPDPYDSETEVEIHKQIFHKPTLILNGLPSNSTMCLACAEDFTTKEELISHVKVSHLFSSEDSERVEREIFICNVCRYIFYSKALLVVHLQNLHKQFYERPVESLCPHCNILIAKGSLWHHFETRGLKSVSTCPFCFLKFPNRKEMYMHIEKHPRYLQCEVCKYQSPKRVHFKNHLKSCRSNGRVQVKNLKLYYVDGNIPPKWSYKVNFVPRGLNLYGMLLICVLCRQICRDKSELKSHLDEVHSEKKLVIAVRHQMCVCGEKFSNKILFKHHVFKLGEGHFEVNDNAVCEIKVCIEGDSSAENTDEEDD